MTYSQRISAITLAWQINKSVERVLAHKAAQSVLVSGRYISYIWITGIDQTAPRRKLLPYTQERN